jgi:HD-GYP domain-containing protein (c-di-GMP phosphodiesterase class II)
MAQCFTVDPSIAPLQKTRLSPPPTAPGQPKSAFGLARGVDRLLKKLAVHDPAVLGHSQRVSRWATLLAAEIGLGQGQTRRLNLAARLHDVGKLTLPRSLLAKPGPLSPDEYQHIQEHPAAGEHLVARVLSDQEVLAAIRGHHERWDGRGYPDGLAGRQIPLLARILAVADGFDAMTSTRPYRAARSWAQALDILRQGAGTQYDSALVDAFLAVVPLAKKISSAPPTAASCMLWFV